eukprot:COSAG06_NODE_1683_length_8730_cov_3.959912_5_plen_127_part_00
MLYWVPCCDVLSCAVLGLQDSNYHAQQQLGMGGGVAAGGAEASLEGFSPSMMMAGTPQDWVEPRGASLEGGGMAMGSPAAAAAAAEAAASQQAAALAAAAEAEQAAAAAGSGGGAGDDDMVQDMEL